MGFYQLMMRNKKPSIYKVLDWIQSTGTQYIDTGIIRDIAHTYRYIGSVNYPKDITSRQLQGSQGFVYFGVIDGYWQVGQSENNHTIYQAQPNTFYDYNVLFDTTQNKVFYQIGNITDEENVNFINNPENAHICLFSLNNLVLPSSCKNKRTQVYKDDVLVRDFVPVRRLTDNEVGMYDTVSKTFFGNAGTGTFFGWKEEPLPSRYQKVDYIEGYGLEYIATGINSNASLTFDITYQYTGANLKGWLNIFGASQRATQSSIQGLFSMNDYYIYVYKGNTHINLGLMDNNKHTVHYGNPTYYDGVYKGNVGNSYSFVGELYIFTCNQLRDGVWVADGTVPMKLWGLSIEINGILVRSYIPVFDTVNNEYGLYDEVSGTFFGNVGNGAFTGGYDNNI